MKQVKENSVREVFDLLDKVNFTSLYRLLRKALFGISAEIDTEEWKIETSNLNNPEDFEVLCLGYLIMKVHVSMNEPGDVEVTASFSDDFPELFIADTEKVLWMTVKENSSAVYIPRCSASDNEFICLKFESHKLSMWDGRNYLFTAETGRYIKIDKEKFTFREPFCLFTRKGEVGAKGVWTPTNIVQMIQGRDVHVYGSNGKETTFIWKELSDVIEHYLKGEEQQEQPFWNLDEHDPTESDIDYKKDAKVITVSLWGKVVCHVSAIRQQNEYDHFIIYQDANGSVSHEVKQETKDIIRNTLFKLGKHVLGSQSTRS